MKQKIVLKVDMPCEKCKTKALKVAAVTEGVISVALEGDEKDKLVVIGENVDSASLTSVMRKKVGNTNLVSVEEVKKKPDDKKPSDKKVEYPIQVYSYPQYPQYDHYRVVHNDPYPSTCSIM
ncbi:hypothetical protein GIB67_037465 [Kingdonia uniflora]|uniref:HMA domain-containing protein n=2 Tax=Kingdonia uniflora TaxID=39325 RepID=A0A7J7N9X3_9MAGN|nr:hypothetical protein GIB67_037825 [Kingdonia uniflora]KAF6164951.1 hypothetical protein GIB67_037465 [Kingdonia uniflora]